MITLNNDNKTIQLSFNDGIYVSTSKKTYRIELPTIICTNKSDAEYIQQQVNTFVVNLARDLLDHKRSINED